MGGDLSEAIALKYALPLGLLRRVQDVARAVAQAKPHPATQRERLCLQFLSRAILATDSASLLFAAGLETDSKSVTRTLAELFIDLSWILLKDQDARIRLFQEYGYIIIRRLKDAQNALRAKFGHQPTPPNALDDLHEKAYERVKGNYKNKNQWSPASLRTKASVTDLESVYLSFYQPGCGAIHSSPETLLGLSGSDGMGAIGSLPWVPRNESAIVSATLCLLGISELAAEVLAPNLLPKFKELDEEFAAVASAVY